MNVFNMLPKYYSFADRNKIKELSSQLNEPDRNKLIGQRCTVLEYNLRKYTERAPGLFFSWMKDEIHYLQNIKGNKNRYLESQINRLKFEMMQLEEETVLNKENKGMEITIGFIRAVIDLIMEEIDSVSR